MNLPKTILCLQCFRKIPAGSVYFECANDIASCSRIKPHCLANKHFFRPGFFGRLIGNYWKIKTHAVCPYFSKNDKCHTRFSISRYCPHCFYPFHQQAGTLPDTIIAVLGPVASGKTEYFRSLEQVLGENFALQKAQFGINVREIDQNREAGATATGFKYPPQVNILTHQRFENDHCAPRCMLVFFDVPGGDWHRLSGENLRFLPFCSALVVICDPLYNEDVLTTLLESGKYNDGGFHKELCGRLRLLKGNQLKAILDKMIAYLEAMGKKLPIALAVSKSDLLRHPSLMHHKSDRFAKVHVDCENVFDIDEEVTAAARWYMQKFEGDIYRLLESWHPGEGLTNYFVVSAFGQPPKDGIIANRSPIRVTDPYIWCLQRLSLL